MPVFCGNPRNRRGRVMGNSNQCFKKGIGVGMGLEREKARIQPPAPAPPRSPQRATNSMNTEQLRTMARARGVPITVNRKRKTKAQLIRDINS